MIPSYIATATRSLRLAWTEANTWFREGVHIHLALPSDCSVAYKSIFTRYANLLQLVPLVLFEVHVRIFCRCEWLLILNVSWNRAEEILALQVVSASNTEQCTHCLSLWCTFQTLLDNKILLHSGHPASDSWVIDQPPKKKKSLMDESKKISGLCLGILAVPTLMLLLCHSPLYWLYWNGYIA